MKNGENFTSSDAKKYLNFLKDKVPLSIEPVIISPQYVYIEPTIVVKYDLRNTNKTQADIKNLVLESITSYKNNNIGKFKTPFLYSKFVANIDDSHESIISNQTTIRLITEIYPRQNISYSDTIYLDNEITGDIYSSVFMFDNKVAYLLSNENNQLDIVSSTDSTKTYLKRNVGSINKSIGQIILRDFKTDETSPLIRIFCETKEFDINSPVGKILQIQDSDIKIRVLSE